MTTRISCWPHGHDWGAWSSRPWQNLLDTLLAVRFCRQCGARQSKAWGG